MFSTADPISPINWSLEVEDRLTGKILNEIIYVDGIWPYLLLNFSSDVELRFFQCDSISFYDAPSIYHIYSEESFKKRFHISNTLNLSSENKKSAEKIKNALIQFITCRCVCVLADPENGVILKFKGTYGEDMQLTIRSPLKVEFEV